MRSSSAELDLALGCRQPRLQSYAGARCCGRLDSKPFEHAAHLLGIRMLDRERCQPAARGRALGRVSGALLPLDEEWHPFDEWTANSQRPPPEHAAVGLRAGS